MKTVIQKIKKIFYAAVYSNATPSKLALSFCLGLYIAFSPFPGGHTIMMFMAHWLFKLNFPVLFFATSINNPWTIIPFYAAEYSFGYWLTRSFFGWHPQWVFSLERFFGSGEICVWSFLIGGNVIGIVLGLFSYPFVVRLFTFLSSRLPQASPSESKEN